MSEHGRWAGGVTYEQMAHREQSTAAKACRLVPMVLALLLVGLLMYMVVLPLSDQWRQGAGTVLVER